LAKDDKSAARSSGYCRKTDVSEPKKAGNGRAAAHGGAWAVNPYLARPWHGHCAVVRCGAVVLR